MRIAIISDIHSNLEALQTALECIKSRQIDEIVCLGDTVGYGANPNECLALLRRTTDKILLGNHDEAACNINLSEQFTPYARAAALWTNTTLTEENKEFLRSLPFACQVAGLDFLHSSPFQPEEWHYVISVADARFNFPYFSAPVAFIGHTHVPSIFCEDLWRKDIVRGKKAIVNVGSIGQPRDHDWRLSFGIFDTESWMYENLRVEYDVQSASQKILQAGLPRPLADRILVGR